MTMNWFGWIWVIEWKVCDPIRVLVLPLFLFSSSAIPLSDPKNQPEIYFLDVVSQANATFHLFEKQFSDSLVPLVR